MRNMRKVDAELFVKVCKCSFDRGSGEIFLPNYDKYLDSCGIEYSDVMRLSEMGLIFNDALISLNFELAEEPKILLVNGDLIMTLAAQTEASKKGRIKQYPFTKVGQELATLVSACPSDESFIDFGKQLAKTEKYKVGIHRTVQIDGDNIRYENTNILEQ